MITLIGFLLQLLIFVQYSDGRSTFYRSDIVRYRNFRRYHYEQMHMVSLYI